MRLETMNANEFKFYCSHCDQPLRGLFWRQPGEPIVGSLKICFKLCSRSLHCMSWSRV